MTEIPISGILKRKAGKIGMWRSAFCEIRINKLLVHKGKSSEIEYVFNITPDTRIKIEHADKPTMFTVRNGNDKISLIADSEESLNKWIIALRTITYSNFNLTMDDFKILSVIGRGFYGKVSVVENKETKEIFALKSIHKSRLIKENKVHTVLAERNILIKADHPFIVNLKFTFQNEKKLYFGLEFVQGGELFRLMQNEETIPFKAVRLYIAEIGLALEHLHSIGVVYRDLKPENILLDKNGHVKLTDFGLSKIVDEDQTTTTFCGTNEYLAPEIIGRKPYSFPVDIWALGILTYELLFGESPFYNPSRHKMFNAIVNKEPAFPVGTDPKIIDFISKLLTKNPKKRPTFESVKQHPFFGGMKMSDVLARRITPPIKPHVSDSSFSNFDSEFTAEDKIDSIADEVTGDTFKGFSYVDPDAITGATSEMPDSILLPPK